MLDDLYDVIIEKNIMVEMRDGVRLATDLYFPARDGIKVDGKFPAVFHRTPYDKSDVERNGGYGRFLLGEVMWRFIRIAGGPIVRRATSISWCRRRRMATTHSRGLTNSSGVMGKSVLGGRLGRAGPRRRWRRWGHASPCPPGSSPFQSASLGLGRFLQYGCFGVY